LHAFSSLSESGTARIVPTPRVFVGTATARTEPILMRCDKKRS